MKANEVREKEIRSRRHDLALFSLYYVMHIDGPQHVRDDYNYLLNEIDRLRINGHIDLDDEIDTLRSEKAEILKKRDTLFEAIKHGDEKHQVWLKNTIEKHFRSEK